MTKFLTKTGIALAFVVGLSACSALSGLSSLSGILSSSAGQSFIGALGTNGTLAPGITSVITKVDSGLASAGTQDALNTVCYALPWADGALKLFGPFAGISANVVSGADNAVQAFVNGVCKTPPTSLAAAIQDGANLLVSIETQLKANGVPVVAAQ